MARTLTTAMNTALAAESGYSDVWLLVLTSSAGTLRFTTAPEDQVWDSNTYVAVGGAIQFDDSSETPDLESQRLGITLGGVDQTVIAVLMGANQYRGRACTIYFGQIQQSTGLVVDDPMEVFGGLLNEAWSIREDQTERGPGSVTISTAATGEAQVYQHHHLAVRTNLMSHNAMLVRAGIWDSPNGDGFFEKVAAMMDAQVMWGEGVGSGGGGGGGGGRKAKPRYS